MPRKKAYGKPDGSARHDTDYDSSHHIETSSLERLQGYRYSAVRKG